MLFHSHDCLGLAPLPEGSENQLLATQDEEAEAKELFGDGHEPAAPLPPMDEEPTETLNAGKPRRHPRNPTKEEADKLNLSHAIYRRWCAIRNRVALKEDPYYRKTAEEINKGLPCIWTGMTFARLGGQTSHRRHRHPGLH